MRNIYKSNSHYLFPILIGLSIIFATVITYVQILDYEQRLSQSSKTELNRIIEGIIDRRESRLQTISITMISLFENSNEVTHDRFTNLSEKIFSSNPELVSIIVLDENQTILHSFPLLDIVGNDFDKLFPKHPTQINGINTMNIEFLVDEHRKLIVSVPFDYFISYDFIPKQDFKMVLFSPLDNNLKLYQAYNNKGVIKTDNVEFTSKELENILEVEIKTNLYGHTIKKNYDLRYQIWDKNFGLNDTFNSVLLIIGSITSIIIPIVIYKTNNILRQKNIELEQIKKSKDEFITMASHELKTPLTPIKGYVELLLSERVGPLTDKQKHYLEIITSDIISLQKLVSDLMDIQKLELGIIKLNLQKENISEIIQKIIEQLKPVLIKHNITISTELSDNTNCVCDKIRIEQVLNNLLNNAMDFIPQNNGKIKIKTTSEQNFVKVTIEDNGIGMPTDKIKNIFSKFYQIDTTITREHGGTGLGLTICKRIIESHGGKIWAESNGVGQGSKFHFSLPS